MNIDRINPLVKKYGLQSLGFFNLSSAEVKKFGMQSLVLIGPDEPNFWKIFSKSPEKLSNVLNPLDTWSKRILMDISKILNAKVFFPFDGPPHWPFYDWALRTGESFKSPINFLVHHRAGLFVSFRGALGFQSKIKKITKSELPLIPCRNCMKPCTNTCPVNAVTSEGYNNLHC